MTMKSDIYSTITNKIIADLERGNLTWLQPWQGSHGAGNISRPFRSCGKPYRGINIIMLWVSAMEHGFANPSWVTYKQAVALGGHVRKGEKGTSVVYADSLRKTETDESGNELETTIPYLKSYTVFNVEQVDGLPAQFFAGSEPANSNLSHIDAVEQFFAATGAVVCHGGFNAFYSPVRDIVNMPGLSAFRDTESYYATLAHEMAHWTSHPARLGRNLGGKRFGDAGYAMEELVAEIGAAFLCSDLGITPETRADHAAYIASWLAVLRNDKRAIFTAASHAQRAADYLHECQR